MMETDETDENWQSNLTNWKSLRKSQSSYQRVQDLDLPEEVPQKPRAKTYKEMMEERQRRKSQGQHSFDDIDNDDLDFGSSKSRGVSRDDSNQDVVMSHKLTQSTANPGSFGDEEIVGQSLRYESEKTETKKETSLPTSSEHPPTSNNHHSEKSHEKVPTDNHKTKTDTDYDFSSTFRDPKKSSNFSSHRDKFETSTPTNPTSAGKSAIDVKTRVSGGANFSDKLKMWNKPTEPTQMTPIHKNSLDQKKTSVITGKENVIAKNSANMYFEKIIRINQRPNHEKGFGFTISGGREHNAPVVVDRVVRGGSADICELKAGDEIIAINGADVARHYNESVENVLAQSVATGTIELKVKRLRDLEEEFEEEVFSDDESKPAAVQKKAHNFSGSQSSLWSSPPSSPPALPSIVDTSEFLTDDLPPPPLPSVPPPPPNWNTFPGDISLPPSEATPVVSLAGSFPVGAAANLEKKSGYGGVNEPRDVPDRSREDMLKKKSQFLGLKLEESEELKALKGDQEKKLKSERLSKDESFSVSDSWNSSVHPPPPPAPTDFVSNKKSSVGSKLEGSSTNASSSSGFTMPGGVGRAQTDWSNSERLEINSKLNFAAEEEARKKEQREQQMLKEKEEQLKLMEEKIRQEVEHLEREKRRLAQETEQQLSLEREKLRQENERQLQRERERLLMEKEEQLRLDQGRLQREKEEMLRHQNEEQLRRDKQRMERDMEEQLRIERERLTREKDEVIKREKERLQREQVQQKEQLEREKEAKLRQQNEEQLRRERQRMEKETEEQLRLERERLMREKDDAIRREKEHLQREQELQKARLQREKEERLHQQNEEQLRRDRQRLETEEHLRLEREKLMREKDEMLKREMERLQREQELEKKELQQRYQLEQMHQREHMENQKQLNSNAGNEYLNRGTSVSYNSQPDTRKLSSEPSDLDVAEYSMKYGGKTFARLAAQTRSDSLGANGSKPPGKTDVSFPRLSSTSEAGFSQELQRPVSKKLDHDNFSSIRSNFENSKTPSKERALEPAPWKHGSQLHHDVNPQFSDDRYPDERRQPGLAEPTQHPSLVPWHGRTVSLGSQVGAERTATVEPQMRGLASSTEPNFEPQYRGSTTLEPHIGKRTTSLGPYGEQTSSFGQPPGAKTLQEQQEAVLKRNQYASPVHSQADEHKAVPPVVGERTVSLGPQSRDTRLGPQSFEGRADQSLRKPSTGEANNQFTMTPLSNISYLLYGEEQKTAQEGFRPEDTWPGGYNSYVQGYGQPGVASVPHADNDRMSTSNFQRDKGLPSYVPPSSGLPAHQFNESSVPHNSSTLPSSKKYESSKVQHAKPGVPKPFDASWKYQSSVGDHWLVEEAERKRISEQTGQERSWNFGSENPHDLQRPRDLLPPEHGQDSSGAWAPVNPYASRPNAVEASTLRSPRSVPEPVKQTLLNRINVGTSLKSPTLLGPLPSYPKDYSQGPPSHSRSVSNPVTDSRLFGNVGPPTAFPPPVGSMTTPSHKPSGGAVDSLFAYHQQVAQPETNLSSLASLSHSQGSLHLDGTPQYSSVSQSYKPPGSYAGPHAEPPNAPQSYPASGTLTNVQGGQQYRIYTTHEPGYSVGRDTGSFPSHCQPVVNNLLCTNCQRPLTEINGRVLMRDGDLKLQCQNCYQENEVKYSKV